MKYLFIFSLAILVASCSVLLKDEKEVDKVIEDVVHDELEHPLV